MNIFVVHRVVVNYDQEATTSSSVVGVYTSSMEAQMARARHGGVITQTRVDAK